jgi:hypothetical protein
MKRLPLLLFTLSMLSSGHAAAQSSPDCRSGDRVRVRSAVASGEFTVLDHRADTLTLLGARVADTLEVPLSTVTRLAVHRGLRSPGEGAMRGAGYGFLVGAGTGVAAGVLQGDDPPENFISFSAADKALILGAVMGGVGAAVGAIAGHRSPGDRWERLIPPGEIRVAPDADGRLALTFRRRL